ncbi:MAG: efflux RND transporter permease subunit, partial [Saprospiraceae bacterium]
MLKSTIRFFLENKLVAALLLVLFVGWGLVTAPFDFGISQLPRDSVAVDAIPDIGENQQIVFTKWPGRSPQNVEDQVTYPLTTALLGIPKVKSVRSNSMFGFSSIYLIFEEDAEFYWSRSRILEKLNSLPPNTLPSDASPMLGPDATGLGQIFWYTLEGRDAENNPTGGWDLHELRSIQDYYVRFGLNAAEGVSEVASIGGYVKEYQVDVDPDAMKANGINLNQVMSAIKNSNLDAGAQTIEINLAEYFVRGLGYVESISDIEESVVVVNENVPIRIRDIGKVNIGPATRRGAIDKSGAEAVGGVVVARYGANPMEVIQNVKEKIEEIEAGLPSKVLPDGTISQVKIIPFYDRTQLIQETLGTLQEGLTLEILITIIVVILMLLNFQSSLLIAGTLPISVLMCFIAMRYFGVDANIVALSGIAIAIGTMVDMGIILVESMVKRLEEAPPEESTLTSIYEATIEVASAVLTAVATTVISFIPVFTMEAAEGKLFRPLAYTKTFALVASIIVAITILPPLAHSIFSSKKNKSNQDWRTWIINLLILGAGFVVLFYYKNTISGNVIIAIGSLGLLSLLVKKYTVERIYRWFNILKNIIYAGIVIYFLTQIWMPLGVNKSLMANFSFIGIIVIVLLFFFQLMIYFYESILRFCLRFKFLFFIFPALILFFGYQSFQQTEEEFMPALNEGSFLLMPTSMPHSGMQENLKNLRMLDMAVTAIPEIENVVGKLGRVESPLDPAPISMYENIINYKSEYKTDKNGHRIRYKINNKNKYVRDKNGKLIEDRNGRYFRQWRDEIQSPDDIWNEIVKATRLPGVTSAPKLQPIETRLIMLQTGMRAPMGIKVKGTDLTTIESVGLLLENELKGVDGVKDAAVFAERIVGKPYMELDIQRDAISRYGLTIMDIQNHIQAAIGGMKMSETVEGRERYAIRLRYPREMRDNPEVIKNILVGTPTGAQIPLGDLVKINFVRGPQSIKSEDGFLVGYVLFDKENGYSEVEIVKNAKRLFSKKIENGSLIIPAETSYSFAGNYEQQVRANQRLAIV